MKLNINRSPHFQLLSPQSPNGRRCSKLFSWLPIDQMLSLNRFNYVYILNSAWGTVQFSSRVIEAELKGQSLVFEAKIFYVFQRFAIHDCQERFMVHWYPESGVTLSEYMGMVVCPWNGHPNPKYEIQILSSLWLGKSWCMETFQRCCIKLLWQSQILELRWLSGEKSVCFSTT